MRIQINARLQCGTNCGRAVSVCCARSIQACLADRMARSQYSSLSPEVVSRSSRLTSIRYLSPSNNPSSPNSCCFSISICISSFLLVAASPETLSCTTTFRYSHCPCVISRSFVMSPVHHLSTLNFAPEAVKC